MTAQDLLTQLHGVKPLSRGGWTARCPAHEDRHASLKVDEGDDGRILVRCHAGCEVQSIVSALGITLRDLYADDATPNGNGKGHANGRRKVATYTYEDADGRPVYYRDRYEWIEGGARQKAIYPRQPDGSKRGAPPLPYRLPAMLRAIEQGAPVILVEGEKPADALAERGYCATTTGSASSWRSEFAEYFRGAHVVLWPDADEPGEKYVEQAAHELAGVAASVRVLRWPGAPEHWDAADFWQEGGTTEQLDAHLADAPAYEPAEVLQETGRQTEPLFDVGSARFGRFLDSEPPPRRWLIEDFLPLGIVGLWAAMGGSGKSALLYQLGVSISAGVPFLGMRVDEVGSVLLLMAEDDDQELHRRGRRILNRMEQDHRVDRAALSERLIVKSLVGENNLLTTGRDGQLTRTMVVERLLATVRSVPDVKLIVLDPASRFMGGDPNKDADANAFVTALEYICREAGATLIVTAHANKLSIREGKEDPDQTLVKGNAALVDGARWVAVMQRMRRDAASRYNVAREDAKQYVRCSLPKTNYTPPWDGLWLRREAGGVLVPAEIDESSPAEQRAAAAFDGVFDRVAQLLGEMGPLTSNEIETKHAGLAGRLAAGQKTVRGVLQRAVADGLLEEVDNPGKGGGKALRLRGGGR